MKTTIASCLCAVLFLTAARAAETPATPSPAVTLSDFKLVGDLGGEVAAFTLTATAKVEGVKGGSLELLSGPVALTDLGARSQWKIESSGNRYLAVFNRSGTFPITVKFHANVTKSDDWSAVDFRVAPSALLPIVLQGLAADTQFRFNAAARPERTGTNFTSFLPVDGAVRFSWKQARPEAEGKLFYAATMEAQISLSPGLMRQVALLDGKIMQGEMTQLTLQLHGPGEVTRVVGDQVLAWNVVAGPEAGAPTNRLLVVKFNQPQKDAFAMQLQMQTPLGAFPQAATALQVTPVGATRFAGHFRIVNDGAVRLEVLAASGLSQISPEQFPESAATRAAFNLTGSQRFAYQFSSPDFSLKVQADQILPEVTVSQLLAYHLGDNELAVDAEFELDIRDAPLRELVLNVPKSYILARVTASGMSDYVLRELPGEKHAELRLVYANPVADRQLVQLRLERNQALGETNWALPHLEVAKAKSVRGFVAVAADAGFRLTAERATALTETPTAFFPRKVAGIQTAFRLSEANWAATLHVERLPQAVAADVFHLFSIGEGIAYGSSVMNYVVSGAPVAEFRVELSDEYFNVEFTGKDIRGWRKATNGYVVQLNTPVAGAYTLLATYERPFKPGGETLAFTGARPLDAQSESGHTIVISAYQFQVKPMSVSPGLLELEPAEVPSEYRLFFDAPILKAYHYSARPFDLKLALSPLAQGDSLNQVVDRAVLDTSISKEGQVLTTVQYFVKNRGNPHFRLTLPEGTALWSATVNGAAVVPVIDGKSNLIPLPQRADPDTVLKIDLKLAARATEAKRVVIAAPIVNAPVMLAQWKLAPDAGQRLVYRKGSLTPVGGMPDVSGFAQLAEQFRSDQTETVVLLLASFALVALTVLVWRWAARPGGYRFSARHWLGALAGGAAVVLAAIALAKLADSTHALRSYAPGDITFLAPVQQAGGALTVEVANLPEATATTGLTGGAWPVALALFVWIFGWVRADGAAKFACRIAGWTLLAWAALRAQNGAVAFLLVVAAFVVCHVLFPAVKQLWQLPRKPKTVPPAAASEPTPAVVALLVGLLWLGGASVCSAELNSAVSRISNPQSVESAGATEVASPRRVQLGDTADSKSAVRPESVVQQIRIEDKFALVKAKLTWAAEKGATLPLLFEPAVMTRIDYPASKLKLVQSVLNGKRVQQLIAQTAGKFDIEVQYQLQVAKGAADSTLALPTVAGLVNCCEVTVAGAEVDVYSPQAVSVARTAAGGNTVASLVLTPAAEAWIGWKPRSRDVKHEQSVFYAEISQLYIPAAGVIEGVHAVSIRPAKGELGEIICDVPAGATITDVTDGASANRQSLVSLWRFDPDTRKLRVTLNPAQSRPFTLVVRSQVATGPLPFEKSVGLISVAGAAGQIGSLGVATGNEVQLDSAAGGDKFAAINLEDFPGTALRAVAAQFPGLTLRRAFRYADLAATAQLKASPVEPDVRVETQDTLSLGEDRTVLASKAAVSITRAGIFKLSFLLPTGYDVESISGAALSHWTELKTSAGRVITLNLSGKTEGEQLFAISLSGPGLKATNGWVVPQLVLREAGKQRGTLLVVPEQGMRLQVAARDGVTQLDPQKSGIRQPGVLAFRVLQSPWQLALDIEQVDAWVQVTSLQHATINEAQVKVAANLQYQIENTGLKAFHVLLPTNAESVHFQGGQVTDFLPVAGTATYGLQEWEVKLSRRVIGQYLLKLTYQTPMPELSAETILHGVQATDVNLQRGFVTVQSGGRLQVRTENAPAALQPAEWQSIPRALQQDLETVSASFAYRLVEADFRLPLKLERHEAAKLLPARVNNITFTSVISDAGVMLTQARLEILPGDKRLLHLTLPEKVNANFWFAFVNQNGVWPWREGGKILIPLEQQSRGDQPIPVEIYFSSDAGKAGAGALDLALIAPKFDLPLENITWRVFLNDKWQVKKSDGTLQFQQEQLVTDASVTDLKNYLSSEAGWQREKTKEAEQMLAFGNTALQKGDPQQARRAFQSAYGLSRNDAAFNEDARVQLNNLKVQQALVGLNSRQSAVNGDNAALGGKFRDLRQRKEINYTQQDAKQIIDSNSADENAAFMKLAQRLVQQQDAAVSSPAVIRASVPEQGRLLTFKRSVVVDREADLNIVLQATAAKAASGNVRLMVLALTALALAGFSLLAGRRAALPK